MKQKGLLKHIPVTLSYSVESRKTGPANSSRLLDNLPGVAP
jgi:hypothetical protein